jgi:broad specificity phosphatase PhoE
MQILFIRHAESTQNKANRENTDYDIHNIVLTDNGKKQASQTGKYINKVFGKIDCIYYSPIYRCQETVEIMIKYMNFDGKIISNELLLEREEHSKLTRDVRNKEKQQIAKEYKKLKIDKELNPFIKLEKNIKFTNAIHKKYKYSPNIKEVYANYIIFLNQIKKLKYKRIVIVAHSKTIVDIINIICSMNIYNMCLFTNNELARIQNCSITCVSYTNKFELVKAPEDKHLN